MIFFSLLSSYNIVEKILKKQKFDSVDKSFNLSVKISVVSGNFKILYIGNEKKIFLLKGNPIKKIQKMQDLCGNNEILCDKTTYEIFKKLSKFEMRNEFYKLLSVKKEKYDLKEEKYFSTDQKSFLINDVYKTNFNGEFRNVISLFSNFKNSSDEKIRYYIENVLNLTKKYKCFLNLIDYSDKGLLCYIIFGAPKAYENDIVKSYEFANELIGILKNNVRVGITYGSAFFGRIGSKKRYSYTSISTVVNLAARLSMKAKWGEILTDFTFANKVRNYCLVENKGFYKFKGVSGDREVYKIGEKNFLEKNYKNRFVGREKELKELTEVLKSEKNKGITFVIGDAGIGKTRFVEESIDHFKDHLEVFIEQSDEIFKDSLEIFKKIFIKIFNISENKKDEKNEKNFEKIFEDLLKNAEKNKKISTEELRRTEIFLKSFLGIESDIYKIYENKVILDNIKIAIKEFIKIKSSINPLFLILDDAQWLDEVSLKFIPELMTNVSEFPFGLIIVSRDDEKIKTLISNFKDPKIFKLNKFDKENIKVMTETILKGPVKEKLLNFIESKSDGNPFFVEQIVLFLNENRYIKYESNGYDIEKIDIDIFSGINSIIIAHLDRLSERLKKIVQYASVLGKEFEVEILLKMLNEKKIEKELKDGVQQNIWYVIDKMKYIFSHSLIKDAAYEMQLEEHLMKLHQLAALAIEEKYKNEPKYFADLALHYEKSKNRLKQIEYLKKAAEFAKKEYREEDALSLNQKLFNILDDEEEKIKTGLLIAHSMFYLTQYQKEDEFIKRMLDYIQDKESNIYAEFLFALMELKIRLSKYEEALETAFSAYDIFKKNNNLKGEINSIKSIGKIYYDLNDYEKSLDYFKQSLEMAKKTGFEQIEYQIIGSMALYYFEVGDYEEGIKLLNKKIEYDRKNNKKREMCYAMGNLGLMLSRKGEFDEALELFKEILKVAKEQGDRYSYSASISNIGMIYYFQKKYDESLKCYQEAFTINEEIGNKYFMAINLGNIGNIYSTKEDFETAQEYYTIAASIFEEIKNYWSLHLAFYELSKINFYKGDMNQMKYFADKSYETALRLKLDDEIISSIVILIKYYYRIGDVLNFELRLNELKDLLKNKKEEEKIFDYNLYFNLLLLKKGVRKGEKYLMEIYEKENNLENKVKILFFLYNETKNIEYKKLFELLIDKTIMETDSIELKMLKRELGLYNK